MPLKIQQFNRLKRLVRRARRVYDLIGKKAGKTAAGSKTVQEGTPMFKEMMDTIGFVTQADPEVGAAMEAELNRQREQHRADRL